MDTLMDSTSGRYGVATKASTYYIDLDRMVLWRIPRTRDPLVALLRRDDELISLVGIQECTVDKRVRSLIDLRVLGVPATLRNTTIIRAIERIPSPGEDCKS